MDINRTITQGEPINEIVIYKDNVFDLVMILFDDLGAAFADGKGVRIIATLDTGSVVRFKSGVIAISSGGATITFPDSFTTTTGDYKCKVRIYDSATDPDEFLTIGTFRLLIRGAESSGGSISVSTDDVKVAVDEDATAGFLGAAATDGVLRFTLADGFTYADGGDFITIGLDVNYADVSGNDPDTDITALELEELSDGSVTTLHSHAGVGTDEFVKIDAGATAGYIGAASGDGVLRTGSGLGYVDGGDFVTISNSSPNVDQNVWVTFNADSGSAVANTTTDAFTLTGGTSITTAIVGDVVTITNDAPNVDQNLWSTIAVPAGTNPTPGTISDTLTFAVGAGISITGNSGTDTVTFANTSPNVDQNLFSTIAGDSGSAVADSVTDTITMVGGTAITTVGASTPDTVTFNLDDTAVSPGSYTGANITVDQQGRITAAASGAGGFTNWIVDADATGPKTIADGETLDIAGGTGISTALSGASSPFTLTVTNDSPNVDQDLWLNVAGDTGSTAANTTTDTLTIAGGTSITTAMSGDTLTITNDDPNVDQNLWTTIACPAGTNPTPDTTTDTLTFAVGAGMSITGNSGTDTITFANTSPNVDQNLFETIAVPAGTNPVADTTADTLTFAIGTGIIITGDSSTDTITFDIDADYADISANDVATDVTGAELETLSDGSTTTLHNHADQGTTDDYDGISANDAATDVSGSELEELTDGSTTTLHNHASAAVAANLFIDSTPADDTAEGIKSTLTVGESVVFPNVTYQNADGKMYLADADGTGTYPALAMVLESKNNGEACIHFTYGYVRDDNWTWTVGGIIYLSDTAGGMTQVAPSTTGDQVQVMGVATHANRMLFQPNLMLVEIN